jgi:hypothetical protein
MDPRFLEQGDNSDMEPSNVLYIRWRFRGDDE